MGYTDIPGSASIVAHEHVCCNVPCAGHETFGTVTVHIN